MGNRWQRRYFILKGNKFAYKKNEWIINETEHMYKIESWKRTHRIKDDETKHHVYKSFCRREERLEIVITKDGELKKHLIRFRNTSKTPENKKSKNNVSDWVKVLMRTCPEEEPDLEQKSTDTDPGPSYVYPDTGNEARRRLASTPRALSRLLSET